MSSPDSSIWVSISAFGVSLIALGFNMWQWSKKQTSEQVDTSRELMDRVTAKQERLGKYEEKTYWNPDKGSWTGVGCHQYRIGRDQLLWIDKRIETP